MTTLAQDTFSRANTTASTTVTTGWGAPSGGGSYLVTTGAGTFSIASNEGHVTGVTALTNVEIGSGTATNAIAKVRVSSSDTNINAIGISLRQTASNTFYRCRISPNSSSIGFGILKTVAGTSTNLVTSTLTVTLNAYYWILFQANGSTLNAKVWADGSAEPAAWTVTITDTSITTAGGYGLVFNSTSGTSSGNFDNFIVTDYAAQALTVTESVTATEIVTTATSVNHTLESDYFNRSTTTSAFGVSTDGNTWVNRQGTSTSLNTNGTAGNIVSSSGTRSHETLGVTTYTDQEVLCKITPSNSSDDFGVDARMSGDASISGVNGYRFNMTASGLVLVRLIGGVGTTLGTATKSFSASTAYWFRFRATGGSTSDLEGRMWTDGAGEPSIWDISLTDSSASVVLSGAPGVTGIATNSTGILYNNFVATDASGGVNIAAVTEGPQDINSMETIQAFILASATIVESSQQIELVSIATAVSGSSAAVVESSMQTEFVSTFTYYNQNIIEPSTQTELVISQGISFAIITEASTQIEQVRAISIQVETIVENSQTEVITTKAFNLIIAGVAESASQIEQVSIVASTVSPSNVQMQQSDLITEYARIRASAAGAQLRILATTYYGNNTNNQVIFGELDALLQNESINNLHVMRTGDDVTAFLKGFSYASNVQADQPAAYYRLDELTGLYAYDLSNNSANAILTNTVSYNQPGALAVSTDGSMGFNGTTAYATIPGFINPANWPALSFECWVNPSASLSPSKRIVGNENPSISNKGALLQAFSSSIIFDLGFGSTYSSLAPSYTLSSGSWYHIVATYDNAFQKIYVNGSVIGSTASANLPIAASTYPFYIAKNVLTTLDGFPGLIDELAIYSYALSSARISAHYLAGTNP